MIPILDEAHVSYGKWTCPDCKLISPILLIQGEELPGDFLVCPICGQWSRVEDVVVLPDGTMLAAAIKD